jgi:O-antigen/teichoic acid export membrane protein
VSSNRTALFDEAFFEPPSFVRAPAAQSGDERTVVRGSAWFVGSVATAAALSFLFLLLAARLDRAGAFGPASSLWAQLQLVNYLTGMGLPLALARFGSGRPRTVHVLFSWALLYTAATSAVGTAIYGVVAPLLIDDVFLAPLFRWGTPAGLVLFFVLTAGMSFALLVEVRLVTLRRWHWVLGRVLLLSLARFPFLALPLFHDDAVGLLVLIGGMPALSGFLGVALLWAATPVRDRGPLLPAPPELRPAFTFATVNYVGMLAAQAPQFALPVVVTGLVEPGEFAAFYLAWQITVMVFLVPHTIGQIVLTEGSRSSGGHQARVGLVLSLAVMVVALVVVWFASAVGLVTALFGDGFALTGELLPRLVAAGIPWAVTSICLARARVDGDHVRTVGTTVAFALLTLVPAALMTRLSGVDGASTAWLLGNTAAAVVALVLYGVSAVRARGDLVPSAERRRADRPAERRRADRPAERRGADHLG